MARPTKMQIAARKESAMAHKFTFPESWIKQRPNLANLGSLYNIDGTVGLNSLNNRMDVLLVQTLLKVYFSTVGMKSGGGITTSYAFQNSTGLTDWDGARARYIPSDGMFSNATMAWIYYYQLFRFAQFPHLLSGKFNPIPESFDITSMNNHALLDLNVSILSMFGKEVYYGLSSNPMIPRELSAAIA